MPSGKTLRPRRRFLRFQPPEALKNVSTKTPDGARIRLISCSVSSGSTAGVSAPCGQTTRSAHSPLRGSALKSAVTGQRQSSSDSATSSSVTRIWCPMGLFRKGSKTGNPNCTARSPERRPAVRANASSSHASVVRPSGAAEKVSQSGVTLRMGSLPIENYRRKPGMPRPSPMLPKARIILPRPPFCIFFIMSRVCSNCFKRRFTS